MYSRQVNGEVLEFGTSGMLYRSNKLMYDRGTNTLWHQFLGEPAVGPLAESGIKLELIPVAVTTWADWLSLHPGTTVLSIDTGVFPLSHYLPEDHRQSIYFHYRNSGESMFPVPHRSHLLPTKSEVVGLSLNGQARAYSLELVSRQRVINDTLAGQELVIISTDQAVGARVYRSGPYRFSLPPAGQDDDDVTLTDQQGRAWRVGRRGWYWLKTPVSGFPGYPAARPTGLAGSPFTPTPRFMRVPMAPVSQLCGAHGESSCQA